MEEGGGVAALMCVLCSVAGDAGQLPPLGEARRRRSQPRGSQATPHAHAGGLQEGTGLSLDQLLRFSNPLTL